MSLRGLTDGRSWHGDLLLIHLPISQRTPSGAAWRATMWAPHWVAVTPVMWSRWEVKAKKGRDDEHVDKSIPSPGLRNAETEAVIENWIHDWQFIHYNKHNNPVDTLMCGHQVPHRDRQKSTSCCCCSSIVYISVTAAVLAELCTTSLQCLEGNAIWPHANP